MHATTLCHCKLLVGTITWKKSFLLILKRLFFCTSYAAASPRVIPCIKAEKFNLRLKLNVEPLLWQEQSAVRETHARFLSPLHPPLISRPRLFQHVPSPESLLFNLIIFVPSGSERDERSHCDSYRLEIKSAFTKNMNESRVRSY